MDNLLRALTTRPRDGHKGTFGTVLVIGGSWGMSGAVALSGMSALRSGAGLVKVAVPERILPIVASAGLEYTLLPQPEDEDGKIALSALEPILNMVGNSLGKMSGNVTTVAVGPGLGQSDELDEFVTALWENLPTPAVFDADALNALARYTMKNGRKNGKKLPPHAGERVITPHPGEFSRLVPAACTLDLDAQRFAAFELARENEIIVVLKGAGTQITDGNSIFRNTTGNPGMATGGSGDVLTGIIAALCAQFFQRAEKDFKNWELFDVVRLAVFLHGKAGDLAAEELGECSVIASDLIRFLPKAMKE
ncbi:MAG: NAD(P)H-hydrate dehydratase [Planctomycetia bacterium]|nr:NAD(P)H-hydrate dehydratase [Planctomycetia bacterium]